MAIRSISNISCSLNLGSIYDISYDYSPTEGVKIVVSFTNESGNFPFSIPLLSSKHVISIGGASFTLYPATYEVTESATSKIARVEFIDDIFILNNYYIALTNRGCGQDIFNVGFSVDKRSTFQKLQDSDDKTAQKIKDFTQFPDLEYTFSNFIDILKQKFSVNVRSPFDGSLSQSFVGTFRDVLDSWCSFYNFAYFFDNGVLNICDPTSLQINLPARPANCLSYSRSESALNTYNTTAAYYYNQEGGEIPISPQNEEETGDEEEDGINNLLIQNATLYPIGTEFNSIQQSVDLNQVAAAQFGREFWFMYNYYKNTALEECGWQRTYLEDISNTTTIYQSILALLNANQLGTNQGGIAFIDQDKFEQKFEFYFNYGRNIAGKYYYSDKRASSIYDERFTWFDNQTQEVIRITSNTNPIEIGFLSTNNDEIYRIINNTTINKYFEGLKYDGNRLLYIDAYERDFEDQFVLTQEQINQLEYYYENLVNGFFGSQYMDFSEISAANRFAIFKDEQISNILAVINFDDIIASKINLFKHRYQSFNIKGMKTADIPNDDEPELEVSSTFDDLVNGNLNQNNQESVIITNGTLQVRREADLVAYYEKYSRCQSAASNLPNVYKRNFIIEEISPDVPVIFDAQADSTFGYKVNRDFVYLNQYFSAPLLSNLAQGWNKNEVSVSFTLNYFYDVGVSFMSNGLTSLNMSIDGEGVRVSYSFSNAILQVPPNPSIQQKIQESIRSSTIRKYKPEEILTA